MVVTERDHLPESRTGATLPSACTADVDYLISRGYNPTRFLGMIAQNKSVVTVAKMPPESAELLPRLAQGVDHVHQPASLRHPP